MRYIKGQKEMTRKTILETGSKLFRKGGIDGVGLAGLMKESKLTNGAFYAHFESKDDLVKEVIDDSLDKRERRFADAFSRGQSLEQAIKHYLSPQMRDRVDQSCVVAALVSEIARQSPETRQSFTVRLERLLFLIGEKLSGSESEKDQMAIALFGMMIGCLQLARAVADPGLSDQILRSGIEAATSLIETGKARSGLDLAKP